MAKKTGPYIGVTGFMSRSEVDQALGSFPEEAQHRLMVGVLMSSKTLAGKTNKWPNRYPKREAIADIFTDDPRALNLIHYNTDNPNNLFEEVQQIVEFVGPRCDGFQFNLTWPSPAEIEKIRMTFPEKYLLLQIGSAAMDEAEDSTGLFCEYLDWYVPHIDAILIDPSGGIGKPFDAEKCLKYLKAIPPEWNLELGIAGGLSDKTAHLLDPIPGHFPKINIDAEGRLRTPQPEDALDMEAVDGYIVTGFLALEKIYHVPLRK